MLASGTVGRLLKSRRIERLGTEGCDEKDRDKNEPKDLSIMVVLSRSAHSARSRTLNRAGGNCTPHSVIVRLFKGARLYNGSYLFMRLSLTVSFLFVRSDVRYHQSYWRK